MNTNNELNESNLFNSRLKEKKYNDFISTNLNQSSEKLATHSKHLVERFKNLNEELLDIMQIERQLKTKEMLLANKKVELLNIERRLKEKNTM